MTHDDANGFKVVLRTNDDTLVSCIVAHTDKLETTYAPGKPAHNENGPLMFFPELEDAEDFRTRFASNKIFYSRMEVWSCTATDARECKAVISDTFHTPLDHIRSWWKGGLRRLYASDPPRGTFVADTITLIERVDDVS